MSDSRTEALAAYWRFFEGFNSRTARSWAAGLNFPHVRLSPAGTAHVVDAAAEHIGNMSWKRVKASGWDHSVGSEPVLVHVGDDCVHLAGGWSRFTRDERLIMTNYVGYVITRMSVHGGDHWGMQARFGIDPGPGGLTAAHAGTAVAVVERFFAAWRRGDFAVCVGAVNLPFVQVAPGALVRIETTEALIAHLRSSMPAQSEPGRVYSVQSGPSAVNVAVGEDAARGMRALAFVTARAGQWGVQGVSLLRM